MSHYNFTHQNTYFQDGQPGHNLAPYSGGTSYLTTPSPHFEEPRSTFYNGHPQGHVSLALPPPTELWRPVPVSLSTPIAKDNVQNQVHSAMDESLRDCLVPGTVIPQKVYTSASAGTRFIPRTAIKFRKPNGALGVLVHEINLVYQLDSCIKDAEREDPIGSYTLRLQWPGVEPVAKAFRHNKNLRHGELAKEIAVCLDGWWKSFGKAHSSLGSQWHPPRVQYEKIYLLELRNASPGSWQPVFSLDHCDEPNTQSYNLGQTSMHHVNDIHLIHASNERYGIQQVDRSPHQAQGRVHSERGDASPSMYKFTGEIVPQEKFVHGQDTSRLLQPVQFCTIENTPGIPLHKALDLQHASACLKDAWSHAQLGNSSQIAFRLHWPGLSSRQQNFTIPKTKMSRCELAQAVAITVKGWWGSMEMENHPYDASLRRWHPSNVKFERLRLLELQNVSQGSWQAVLGVETPEARQSSVHANLHAHRAMLTEGNASYTILGNNSFVPAAAALSTSITIQARATYGT